MAKGKGHHLPQAEFQQRLAQMKDWLGQANDDQRTTILAAIQPFFGASQYHWLSYQLPEADLHAFCRASCNDVFQAVPVQVAHQIISYLDPASIAVASRELIKSISHFRPIPVCRKLFKIKHL